MRNIFMPLDILGVKKTFLNHIRQKDKQWPRIDKRSMCSAIRFVTSDGESSYVFLTLPEDFRESPAKEGMHNSAL